MSERYKILGLFTLILIFIIPFIYKFGFYINIENIFLKDVNETRKIFSLNCTGLLDYFFNWLSKVILPVSFIYFLIKKKYFLSIFAISCLFYLYFISGNRITYLTCFAMFFFYVFGKTFSEKILWFLAIVILVLLCLPVIDSLFYNSPIMQGTFVMRMLFFPSLLNHYYFDFFAGKPLFFAESQFFNLFVSNPYSMKIGHLISQTYFNTLNMYANNGIVSDGFMNLGFFGVFLNSIILSIIFLFFGSIKIDTSFFGYFIVLIFLLLSTPMFTVINTSGLWLMFLLAIILKDNKKVS